MEYADFFSVKRTTILHGETKEQVFEELAELIVKSVPGITIETILEHVRERESLVSTRITETLAIPHAWIPEFSGTVAAVGLSRGGIIYDAHDNTPVKLVVLIVGDGKNHLQALSWAAERLDDEERMNAIMSAGSSAKLYSILTGKSLRRRKSAAEEVPSAKVIHKAYELAGELAVNAVIYHTSSTALPVLGFKPNKKTPLYMVVSDRTLISQKIPGVKEIIHVPFRVPNRTNQAELVLIYLISQGIIEKGQKILSVLGSPEKDLLDTIILSDSRDYKLFLKLGRKPKPLDLEQQVFSRAIQMSSELAYEGREGKPVGTLFILGDHEKVLKACQQMVVNPFGGYKEENRNILDPGLEATIKEFAKIDGAFIIRGDGVIVTSGAFIKAQGGSEQIQKGFGARHTAAANISAATDALAIALSESTRRVSVFKSGKRIMYF
ncbi:MAG: PTS sugar transporter subunit IIA [Chitinispirillales bacterium]|jgi:DNA integrity scanning protein DisA with diadenylate cyclase activity/mannitol/fructose-specific phosphotransferase system IIA component (Ntr-type)|nr:PTS sugar transporter subunit IIA [Chitinispirillales bacterium]